MPTFHESLSRTIFNIRSQQEFNEVALQLFQKQAAEVDIYGEYIHLLGVDPAGVRKVEEIPFLPISFFKSHKVLSTGMKEQLLFESSGTTGVTPSRHYVADTEIYVRSFSDTFNMFFGPIEGLCVMALLPSYLERGNSSLVYMTEKLIQQTNDPDSGFFLNDLERLHESLSRREQAGQKTLLLGVSFALLDFAERFPMTLDHTLLMETGGMKGRRKELVREELHTTLEKMLGVEEVASEYGMTELLSQAYALKNGRFNCPPWMNVSIRDTSDPFSPLGYERTGGINVIDLANIHSCAFIATQDLGRKHKDGSFEVLGRFDHSDIRGCSLLVVE